MSVTALVINYNAGKSLQRCVGALMAGTLVPRVMVVDNASSDGSAKQLQSLYGNQGQLQILINPTNMGFARAINQSVKLIDSERMLVINPDCLVDRETLAHLQKALDEDESAALAAPCVLDNKGKPEKATLRRFPDPWNSLMTMTGLWRLGRWISVFRGVPFNAGKLPTETSRAEAVSGACMLIRRKCLVEVGLMDEAYGLHCEDLDLMYRFRDMGWHCLFVPAAKAVHEQGVSSRSRPFWVHKQKHKGMARFFRKFQAPAYGFPVRWLVYSGIWIRFVLLTPLVWIRK